MRLYGNVVSTELERNTIELEFLCCVCKMPKDRNGDVGLVEEPDFEPLKERSRDTRKKLFQVRTDALERKPAKVSEYDVCHNRRWQRPHPNPVVCERGEKGDGEFL